MAHLRPRTNTLGAVARVRHCLSMAIHRYFHEHGFFWVHTPDRHGQRCRGRGRDVPGQHARPGEPRGGAADDRTARTDFTQDFFGKEAFLTVSGQLNVETYCLALSKVYTFGPTFRAENSNTSRHLAEFWMVEPEIAFADLAADADLAESFLKYILDGAAERARRRPDVLRRSHRQGLHRAGGDVRGVSFERHDLHRARSRRSNAAARRSSSRSTGAWTCSPSTSAGSPRSTSRRPVVVMNYPKEIKAFYMRLNDDGKTVAAMDVLAPGIGEIIGGSQREERLDVSRSAPGRAGSRSEGLLVVPRPAPLRHRAARRLRPGPRAHDHLCDRDGEHPRCDSVPAHAGQCGVLKELRRRGRLQPRPVAT